MPRSGDRAIFDNNKKEPLFSKPFFGFFGSLHFVFGLGFPPNVVIVVLRVSLLLHHWQSAKDLE